MKISLVPLSLLLVILSGPLLAPVLTSQIEIGPVIPIDDPVIPVPEPIISDPIMIGTPIVADPPVVVSPPLFAHYTLCNANTRPRKCSGKLQSVCAYIKNCIGGSCTKTVPNACSACADKSVQGYFDGACKDIETKCVHIKERTMCMSLYFPVCALALNCQGPDCSRTEANSCYACNTNGVDLYLPGQCPPKPEDDDKIAYCDSENRAQACSRIAKPVCGVKADCFGNYCRKSFSNACRACASSEINYYVEGDCRRY